MLRAVAEVLRRKEIFEAMAERSGRDKELPGAEQQSIREPQRTEPQAPSLDFLGWSGW